jgi:hypothetical protein
MKSSINKTLSNTNLSPSLPQLNLSRFDALVNKPLTELTDFGIIKTDMTDLLELAEVKNMGLIYKP